MRRAGIEAYRRVAKWLGERDPGARGSISRQMFTGGRGRAESYEGAKRLGGLVQAGEAVLEKQAPV